MASAGANMFISLDMLVYSLTRVHININKCKFFGGKSTSKGGGFMLQVGNYSSTVNLTVYLANSELYSNSAVNGSGLYLDFKRGRRYGRKPLTYGMFNIQQCICHDNVGEYGLEYMYPVISQSIGLGCQLMIWYLLETLQALLEVQYTLN